MVDADRYPFHHECHYEQVNGEGIRNTCGRFIRVHFNVETRIIRMEATLTEFGNLWFDNRCILNILSLLKDKNKYCVMYDITEGS